MNNDNSAYDGGKRKNILSGDNVVPYLSAAAPPPLPAHTASFLHLVSPYIVVFLVAFTVTCGPLSVSLPSSPHSQSQAKRLPPLTLCLDLL